VCVCVCVHPVDDVIPLSHSSVPYTRLIVQCIVSVSIAYTAIVYMAVFKIDEYF